MHQDQAVSRIAPATKKDDCLSQEAVILLKELIFGAGLMGRVFSFPSGPTLIARPHDNKEYAVIDVTGADGKFRGFIVDRLGKVVDVYLDNGLQVELDALLKSIPNLPQYQQQYKYSKANDLTARTLPPIPVEWHEDPLVIPEIKHRPKN